MLVHYEDLNINAVTGTPPGMFERGGPKRVGGLGVLPHEKKIRVFKFWCSKWPILTEMTVKYGKYFKFPCQQGGISPLAPPVVPSGGVRTPPGLSTLYLFDRMMSVFIIYHTAHMIIL